jgi:hypothetical protein
MQMQMPGVWRQRQDDRRRSGTGTPPTTRDGLYKTKSDQTITMDPSLVHTRRGEARRGSLIFQKAQRKSKEKV